MNKEQFATIAAVLHRAYGRANIMPDEGAIDLWYHMLKDIDYLVCRNAVTQIISQNKFAPAIAEIREKCAAITTEKLPEWDEAWGMVLKAIRKYGYPREQEALESLPEAVCRIVKRMGYQNICQSENIGVERANFRMAYENESKYQSQSNMLPSAVRRERQLLADKFVGELAAKLEYKEEPK